MYMIFCQWNLQADIFFVGNLQNFGNEIQKFKCIAVLAMNFKILSI